MTDRQEAIEAKLNEQERLLDKQKSLHAELRASLLLEKLAPGCFDHGKVKVLYIPGPYKKYPRWERHVDVAVIRGDGHRIDLPRGSYEKLGSPELNFQKPDPQRRTR